MGDRSMSLGRHRATGRAGQRRRVARAPRPLSSMTTFLLEVGDADYLVRIHRGPRRGRRQGAFRPAALDLRAEGLAGGLGNVLAAGAAAGRPRPDRHDQDAGAAPRRRPVSLHVQPALLQGPAGAAARAPRREVHDEPGKPAFEPAVGRYLRLDIGGKPHRLYVEEAGAGHPARVPAHGRLRRPAVPRPPQRCRDARAASASSPSTCPGTASPRRRPAGRRASTSSPRAPTSTPSWP